MLICSLTSVICANSAYSQVNGIFNIVNFGATTNKKSNAKFAIQKAIDACSNAGGGTVFIPDGNFYSSTVYLRSNIDLHFSNGANLFAIADSSLYKNDKEGLEDAGDSFIPALIVVKKQKNVSITGNGSIIGPPEFYYTLVSGNDVYPGFNENARKSGADMNRPWVKNPKVSLVYISDSENITLNDISIIDSPNWSCHIQWSNHVSIARIKIKSSLNNGVNSDGLDIDGCKKVVISDCIIETGDDAICIKTTVQGSRSETAEDILVNNCVLSSSSCALKIGTETNANISRIIFSNCTISNSNRAIGIIVRDGAIVDNVTFSNILLDCYRKPFYWWGNGEAFHFSVLKRNKDSKLGLIKNVVLDNIRGTVEGSSSILGYPQGDESSIQNVTLSAISLQINAEREKDKRTRNAINIVDAKNISMEKVAISWNKTRVEPLWERALFLKSVVGYTLSNSSIAAVTEGRNNRSIFLQDTKDGFLAIRSLNNQNTISVSGVETNNINIETNALNAVSVDDSVSKKVNIKLK
ncbi:glycoside hydrolase family 28 protein [Pedobacter sp. UYEF25]